MGINWSKSPKNSTKPTALGSSVEGAWKPGANLTIGLGKHDAAPRPHTPWSRPLPVRPPPSISTCLPAPSLLAVSGVCTSTFPTGATECPAHCVLSTAQAKQRSEGSGPESGHLGASQSHPRLFLCPVGKLSLPLASVSRGEPSTEMTPVPIWFFHHLGP